MISLSRNRIDRFIVEYLDRGRNDAVLEVTVQRMPCREIDAASKYLGQQLAQIHECHEAESGVIDVGEQIYGRLEK